MGTTWNLRPLAGVMLRYEVCLVLRDAGRPLTIPDIIACVRRDGFELPEHANKAISDALRWELRRNRVDRLRRGLYTSGRVPRSSEFRMRRRIADARQRLALGATSSIARAALDEGAAADEEIRNSLERGTIWAKAESGGVTLDLDALEAAVAEERSMNAS